MKIIKALGIVLLCLINLCMIMLLTQVPTMIASGYASDSKDDGRIGGLVILIIIALLVFSVDVMLYLKSRRLKHTIKRI